MSAPGVSHPSPTTVEDFNRVLDVRAVRPVFQPLVDLDNRHVVGYEALARGPLASALETPAALFGAAWRAGRVAELDWACRPAAFTEADRGGLGPPLTLFVNAEPVSLGVACPDDLKATLEEGRGRLRVVVEVTERALAGDPARLLATVARARQAGCGAAWTTSGPPRHPGRAAVRAPRPDQAGHAAAPGPPAPPSARGSCSATRGCCPPPCPSPGRPSRSRSRPTSPPRPPGRWWRRPERRAGPSRTCWWRWAWSWSTRAWTRPSPRSCWPASRRPTTSPRFAAALVARDLGDDGPDERRRYDVVVTHDRDLVIRAAEPLLRRLVPDR